MIVECLKCKTICNIFSWELLSAHRSSYILICDTFCSHWHSWTNSICLCGSEHCIDVEHVGSTTAVTKQKTIILCTDIAASNCKCVYYCMIGCRKYGRNCLWRYFSSPFCIVIPMINGLCFQLLSIVDSINILLGAHLIERRKNLTKYDSRAFKGKGQAHHLMDAKDKYEYVYVYFFLNIIFRLVLYRKKKSKDMFRIKKCDSYWIDGNNTWREYFAFFFFSVQFVITLTDNQGSTIHSNSVLLSFI